jgi:hypothetical protein
MPVMLADEIAPNDASSRNSRPEMTPKNRRLEKMEGQYANITASKKPIWEMSDNDAATYGEKSALALPN